MARLARCGAGRRATRLRGDLHLRSLPLRDAPRDRDRGSSDAWTMLVGARRIDPDDPPRHHGLAGHVPQLPAVLAKAAVTVDRVSGGRVEIGMGAGWWEDEHRTHGFAFPRRVDPVRHAERTARDRARTAHGGARSRSRASTISSMTCRSRPRACRTPHPPIVVGGNGGPRHRGARLAVGRRVQHRRSVSPSRRASGSAACATGSTPTAARRTRSRPRS